MNSSEDLVYQVCKRSFLSFWSYANPRGKQKGKELCDILIVCDPDVIIVSVKDRKLTDRGDLSVDWARWRRNAIEDSCKQIYGAERWLKSAAHVVRGDGSRGLPFPKEPDLRIHRVAVAFGGEDRVPLQSGDFGKGFVHVFDEISFATVLREFDTIPDFVTYMMDTESLADRAKVVAGHPEIDLLPSYLLSGRRFPTKMTKVPVGDGTWGDFTAGDAFKSKRVADEGSYVWDDLIEYLSEDATMEHPNHDQPLSDTELVLRVMARESRFSRRLLGNALRQFLNLANQGALRTRLVKSSVSQVAYVFLALPSIVDREQRIAELANRCFIARGLNPQFTTVVGIATEREEDLEEHSVDYCYVNIPFWNDDYQRQLTSIQQRTKYFTATETTAMEQHEYPIG